MLIKQIITFVRWVDQEVEVGLQVGPANRLQNTEVNIKREGRDLVHRLGTPRLTDIVEFVRVPETEKGKGQGK